MSDSNKKPCTNCSDMKTGGARSMKCCTGPWNPVFNVNYLSFSSTEVVDVLLNVA